MIVYTNGDTVRLSGALVKNQWLTIKAAANLLLQDYPEGIVIDCGELRDVTSEGAKTFLDAIRDIQSGGSRIVVSSLPAPVHDVLRTIPGVRSMLPIANTIEEARESLRPAGPAHEALPPNGIVVPVLGEDDHGFALSVACAMARDRRLPVIALTLVEVARNLAIGTPMPEAETRAKDRLDKALGSTPRAGGIQLLGHLERVRSEHEGLIGSLRGHQASAVVLEVGAGLVDDEARQQLVELLITRAPCDVIIARRRPADAAGVK